MVMVRMGEWREDPGRGLPHGMLPRHRQTHCSWALKCAVAYPNQYEIWPVKERGKASDRHG